MVVAELPAAWHRGGVVAVFVVIGAADAITGPALDALVPTLVAASRLGSVMGLMDLTGRLIWAVGPAAALALIPAEGLFIADAATFGVLASVLVLVHRASASRVAAVGKSEGEVITQSARVVVRRHPRVGTPVVLAGVGDYDEPPWSPPKASVNRVIGPSWSAVISRHRAAKASSVAGQVMSGAATRAHVRTARSP